jgi:hypothetical protein
MPYTVVIRLPYRLVHRFGFSATTVAPASEPPSRSRPRETPRSTLGGLGPVHAAPDQNGLVAVGVPQNSRAHSVKLREDGYLP